jgi:hypothetical protein
MDHSLSVKGSKSAAGGPPATVPGATRDAVQGERREAARTPIPRARPFRAQPAA